MKKDDYKKLNLKNGVDTDDGSKGIAPRQARRAAGQKALSPQNGTVKARKDIQDGEKKPAARKVLKIVLVLVIICAALGFARMQFGPPILRADISAYAEEQILVSGLTEEDFYITPRQLSEMKLTRATAEGNSDKAGVVTAIGPTLDTFLEQYGKKTEDFKQVKFYASDDYTTVLVKTLYEKEIILSIANGKEALDKYQQPLRVVIPDEDSGKWIRLVTKIEFTQK